MPGYGKRMERYSPMPTEDVQTIESRFVMPKLTFVQLTIVGLILAYAWTVRKANRAVVSTFALALGLLHIYDHMYRVKRGNEHLFILPAKNSEGYTAAEERARKIEQMMATKKEGYCGACRN